MAVEEGAQSIAEVSASSTTQRILVGLSKVSLAMKSQSWQNAGQYGISPTQAQILTLLQSSVSQGMRLSDIAEGLAVKLPTASDAVRVLVEKNLIQKVRSAKDGRVTVITLTPQGKALADKTAEWPNLFLDAVEDLSALEQGILLRGLLKIIQRLQTGGKIPTFRMCITCRFFEPNRYSELDRPHHCHFLDLPFGDRNLQVDCPDHSLMKSVTS